MNHRTIVASLIACAVFGAGAGAQESFRLSISAGPTMAIHRHKYMVSGVSTCDTCASRSELVSGASQGWYHVSVGVSRPLAGSALTARGEALYNRSASLPLTFGSRIYDGIISHTAERDESFIVGVGLEWDAFPDASFTPYVLTSAGLNYNRLQWRMDPASDRLDGQADAMGPFAAFGGGMRVTVGEHEFFTEWRKYRTFSTPGSDLAPLSFGFRF